MSYMPHESSPESRMGPRRGFVPTSRLLAKQPIHIAAIKAAVGIDTLPCMFEMKCTHNEKEMPPNPGRPTLIIAWLFLGLGLLATALMVVINL